MITKFDGVGVYITDRHTAHSINRTVGLAFFFAVKE